jgi:hypothetical protein
MTIIAYQFNLGRLFNFVKIKIISNPLNPLLNNS